MVIVLEERVNQLRSQFENLDKRVTTNEQRVATLDVVLDRIESLRSAVVGLQNQITELDRKQHQREEWIEGFRVQMDSLQTAKGQNIKSGYLTLLTVMIGFIGTTAAIVTNVVIQAVK